MGSRVGNISVVGLLLTGLIVFFTSAPLAHLHPVESHGAHAHEQSSLDGATFHVHIDGHAHPPHGPDAHDRGCHGHEHDDGFTIPHGCADSPRDERLVDSPVVLTSWVHFRSPLSPADLHVDDPHPMYRPLPLLFRKPVRAPPTSS